MRNNQWYASTERLIAKHLWAQERLARLRDIERSVTENLANLQQSLEEGKRIPGFTAKYGLAPGNSRGGDNDYSALMEEYERQVDRLTKEILFQRRRLIVTQVRIAGILNKTSNFDCIFSRITAEERHILEQRHIYKRSNAAIAHLYGCDESTIRRRQVVVVQFVYRWMSSAGKRRDEDALPVGREDSGCP